jgi:spermidine synthase
MLKSKYIQIGLISLSLIAIELSWTRIFSAEFYYSFAFLILSIAILGLGLGALSLRLFKKLNTDKVYNLSLSFTALCALLSPIIIFQINLDFSQLYLSFAMTAKFAFAVILLASSFFFGGIAISYLLKNAGNDLPKLYMADLIGAGSGVLVIILLMNVLGTPLAVTLISLPISIIALSLSSKKQKVLPVSIIILTFIIGFFSESWMEIERKDRGKILFTHWDAMSKIRVVEYNEFTRGIRIDNAAQTSVYKFNGDFQTTRFRFDVNVANLIQKFENCVFLSLGAGGGVDVLHALQENATEVHAVEVNPYINDLLEDGKLAEYTGYVYKDPRVRVVTEDARTYVRRFENKFDIIFALSSNSYAALASGAFALAENYLFTTEAFLDYWNAMSEDGYLVMEHHFYVPRMVSEVMDALNSLEIQNPETHFAVYNLPNLHRNILLLSKKPLDEFTIERAFGVTLPFKDNFIYPLYPAHDSNYTNLVNQIVLQGWRNLQESTNVDISPCPDDRPFIAQMGMWKNLNFSEQAKILPFEFTGFPLSKLNLLVIIGVIVLLIIPLNIIPYKVSKEKLRLFPWLYFFAIGMGFMMIEVLLIQKYTLFIGASVYSIVTILLTLLIASGLGSRFSDKFSSKLVFPIIVLWVVLEIFLFTKLTYLFGGLTLPFRILLSIIFIAPLGFFMGMPFPKAGKKVGKLVDWGFAVNGAASVLGSVGILLISISYGFRIALIIGACCYIVAMFLILNKNKWA